MSGYTCGDGKSATQCEEGEIQSQTSYANISECCKGCGQIPACGWFVFDTANGECTLHSNCTKIAGNNSKSVYTLNRSSGSSDGSLSGMWIAIIVISVVLIIVIGIVSYWKRFWIKQLLCNQHNVSPRGKQNRNGPSDTEDEDGDYEMKNKPYDNCSTPTPPALRALPSQSPPDAFVSQEYREWDLFNKGLEDSRCGNIYEASLKFNEARGAAPDDQLGETVALSKALQFGYSVSVSKSLLESQRIQHFRQQSGWPSDWGYASYGVNYDHEKLPKNNYYSPIPSPNVTADNFTEDSNNGDMEALDESSVFVDSVC